MNIETVQTIYHTVLKFHVYSGFLGYLFLFATLLSISKSSRHRKWGICYWLMTSLVCYSSIICGVIYLLFFRNFVVDPGLIIETTIIFLIHMSFLSIGVLNSGREFIQFSKGNPPKLKLYTAAVYGIAFLISIYLGIRATQMHDWQLFFISMIAMPLYIAWYFWRMYRSQKRKIKSPYIYWHVQSMLISTVAYHTPMLTGGMARTYFPEMYKFTAQYLFICPAILGLIIIMLIIPFRKNLLKR